MNPVDTRDTLATGDDPSEEASDSEDTGGNGIKFKDWGFKVDRLFEVAYRFYKRNESKAFHPTFDERNQMNALILQARYGNYDSDKIPDVGILDLVGKNRQHQWSLLKGLSRMEAMSKFVCTLDQICPLFKAHAEAVKLSTGQTSSGSVEGRHDENGRERSDSQKMRDELQSDTADQLALVKKSLSRQTYSQFKSYAEKQQPNDISKQRQLIDSLQEQYFQQYISQMYPVSSPTNQEQVKGNTNGHHQQEFHTSNLNPEEQQSLKVESVDVEESKPSASAQIQSQSVPNLNPNPVTEEQFTIDLANQLSNFNISTVNNLNSTSQEIADKPEFALGQQEAAPFVAEPQSLADLMGSQNDSSCSTLSEESSIHRSFPCEALEPASIWTKKSVKEFKASLIGDPMGGEYLLKQGKLVTIQVPTYPNGKYIYWEFVTDDYDVGFGLDFAYEDPQRHESMELKIFEQTDDEDEEEDLIESEVKMKRDTLVAADQAHSLERSADKPPKVENTIAIVPTYRRNSHEEVFIGRHRYPGHGYYLLRFDNTYSVLRSKSLHFRICYFI